MKVQDFSITFLKNFVTKILKIVETEFGFDFINTLPNNINMAINIIGDSYNINISDDFIKYEIKVCNNENYISVNYYELDGDNNRWLEKFQCLLNNKDFNVQ